MTRTLIVGVGSAHGDDQAGWRVANRLAADGACGAEVRLARSPSDLLDWIEAAGRLIVCDAYHGAEPAGAVRHWVWPAAELETVAWSGTHNLGLCAVLELAETLGRLPPRVGIWGIQVLTTSAGEPMSAEVSASVDALVKELRQELDRTAGVREVSPRA